MTDSKSLYVVREPSGLLKIGISKDVAQRTMYISARDAHGAKLVHETIEVENPYDAERSAHGMLATHRVRGEWFSVSEERAILAVDTAVQNALLKEGFFKPVDVLPDISHRLGGPDETLKLLISMRPELIGLLTRCAFERDYAAMSGQN